MLPEDIKERLTKTDLKSLEAACYYKEPDDHTTVTRTLKPVVVQSLKIAGLEPWEIQVCELWAGLNTYAGVDEESRDAHLAIQNIPLPDPLGVLDEHRFWVGNGTGVPGYHRGILGHMWELNDCLKDPKTTYGKIGAKVLRFWKGYAEQHMLTPKEAFLLFRGSKITGGGKRKLPEPTGPVKLSEVWRVLVDIDSHLHRRGHLSEVRPEHVYDQLGEYQTEIDVNCWARDDDMLLEVFKKFSFGTTCSRCGMYTADMYGFSFTSNSKGGWNTCYACMGMVFCDPTKQDPIPVRPTQDRGPTIPECDDARYRWAITHGYMWDEFMENVLGQPHSTFDPSKKKPCPLAERCNTRCALDQRSGVRGWPLGASTYETSCLMLRQIRWTDENGGTEADFDAAEKKALDRRLAAIGKEDKARRAQERKQAVAAPAATPVAAAPEEEKPAKPAQLALL